AAQGSTDFITPKEAVLSGYWLPQIGRLPVTVTVAVTVPRGWAVFTQGVPAGKDVSADGRSVTVRYASTLPVSYPSLAAGPYQMLSAPPAGGMTFGVSVAYLHAADRPMAHQALQTAQAALGFYATHFSPYPFPRYTVVISDRFGLALEGYSMTTISHGYGPNVLPHEISHTWWGGVVPNTYLRDLWNESFAEYSDGLYERLTGRRDGMHLQETEPVRLSGMLAADPVSLRQAHDALDVQQALTGYMRGSLMLEALEQMIGQKAMLASMQALIARHTPYQADTWDDFVAAVTATAGARWQGFFDAWLPSAGLPALRLRRVRLLRVPSGQEIEAEVAQQPGAPFWLRVPVELQLKRGRARQDVMLTAPSAPVHFYLSPAAKPVTLEIDPQKTLLRAYDPTSDSEANAPTTYRFPAARPGAR
ncbi:MAG TPA: M1 family aminopeptidase, partial [Chthonomonadaceae bacterium]|nr:M1 family aminopeptidase [Chthonomonadaceae bacterium]